MIKTSLQLLVERLFFPITPMRGVLTWFRIIGPWFFWFGFPFTYIGYVWVVLALGSFVLGVSMATLVLAYRNNPDLERHLGATREGVGAYLAYTGLVLLSAILAGSVNTGLLYAVGDLLAVSCLRIKD